MKKNKKNYLKIASIILVVIILIIVVFTIVTYNKEVSNRQINIDKIGMKFIIEDKEYKVNLSNNNTTLELLDKLPIETDIAKYEDSLYIAMVNGKLTIDGERVSEVKKNNIYYHPGWDALVIVYKDYEFENKLIHIGSFKGDIDIDDFISKIEIDVNKKE